MMQQKERGRMVGRKRMPVEPWCRRATKNGQGGQTAKQATPPPPSSTLHRTSSTLRTLQVSMSPPSNLAKAGQPHLLGRSLRHARAWCQSCVAVVSFGGMWKGKVVVCCKRSTAGLEDLKRIQQIIPGQMGLGGWASSSPLAARQR